MDAKEAIEWRMSVFPNYKPEMYYGNMPAGKGHQRVDGGYMDRWEMFKGGGESYDGIINNAQFSINHKVSVNIVGNHLQILDIRYDGKPDIWEYTNKPSLNLAWSIIPAHYHELEPERIEQILNTKFENCKFWDMVQARAKELYANGLIMEYQPEDSDAKADEKNNEGGTQQMAQHILIDASDVWDLFINSEDLHNEYKIAENPEYGTEIFLSERNEMPEIVVYMDQNKVYSELCTSADDCEATAQKVYDKFLTEQVFQEFTDDDDEEQPYTDEELQEQQADIDTREEELDMALDNFLDVVFGGQCIPEEIRNDLIEHFLKYMYEQWSLPIYRPMYLEDEEGVYFEEYPYADLVEQD